MDTFLTSYDPSDLPGASIDPLGFERGYLFLADKILPGLTNVASRPRYFAVLCAGASLCNHSADQSPRELLRARQEIILRFERLWALANVLARPDASGGVRGVTYAQDYPWRGIGDRSRSFARPAQAETPNQCALVRWALLSAGSANFQSPACFAESSKSPVFRDQPVDVRVFPEFLELFRPSAATPARAR